jgi:hypothetical protein
MLVKENVKIDKAVGTLRKMSEDEIEKLKRVRA